MELVMRLLGAILLSRYFGFTGVCWASPLAWLGAAVPLTIAVYRSMKKLNRQGIADRKQYSLS
jgi:Na+-driven multidrug efflux pump